MVDFGKWAFDNRNFVRFFVVVLLLGGLYSAYKMSKLEDPEIKVKVVMVVAVRPGASPLEMEKEVTEPLERALGTMDDVECVQSWSHADIAFLQVELRPTIKDENLAQCRDVLRHKVFDCAAALPDGTEVFVQDDFNAVYGMFYALTADGCSMRELSDYAALIQRELTNIDGVGSVALYGGEQECINITLSPERLASLGVSPAEILATLGGHSGTYYAGYYNCGTRRVRIAVADKFRAVEQIEQMIICGHEADRLRLCDVASVTKGFREPHGNRMKFNGKPTVGIAVAAASGSDILKVGAAVGKRLGQLLGDELPAGVECRAVFYQPDRVKEALADFFINLLESLAIVLLVLMLTMGLRSGIIIGVTLLTIVVGTFLVLSLLDGSMQRVSLAAFILAMGMLVDNAIVIVDGILNDLGRGRARREAMTATGRRTALPLLGATLIAILAFLPIFLSPDTAGVYVRDLFIVLAVSLLLSWLLALTHVPLMADRLLRVRDAAGDMEPRYDGLPHRVLRRSLGFCFRHKSLAVLCVVLLLAASMIGFGYVRQGFFPDMTYDQLYMEYKLPEGTSSERVEEDLRRIGEYLAARDEVTDVTTSIGATPARYNLVRSIATPSPSYGELIVSFVSPEALDDDIAEIQDYLTRHYPEAYVKLKKYNIMYKKYPIELRLTGPDVEALNSLADSLRRIMARLPELRLVTTDWDAKQPFMEADYNQMTASASGVGREDISVSLLAAAGGAPVGRFYDEGNENIIYLKCAADGGRQIDNLENVPIFSMLPNVVGLVDDEWLSLLMSGTLRREQVIRRLNETTRLSALGSGVNIKWEYPTIARYNGRRTLTLMCSPCDGTETEAARQRLSAALDTVILPAGYSLSWGGEKEAKEQTMHYLFGQLPPGVILIVAVLILLFKDYRRPLIILCCVPLPAVGIVAGMLLSDKVFNFCAIVGALGLMGMLMKNCIVLMDEINLQTSAGVPTARALVESACSRLRPVLMASLTTILGMIPLLGDDLFGSLAVTIMGGLLFSTLATLVCLPLFYAISFKVKC